MPDPTPESPVLRIFTAPPARPDDRDTAHRLLRYAWSTLHPGSALPAICTGPDGKPDFAAGGHFSLSHTATLAAAALYSRPVGVDAETLRPVHPRLFRRVLAGPEQTWLAAADSQTASFLQLWTLKEAYLKYTGTGLQGLPRGLCFCPAADGAAALAGHPEITAGSLFCSGCVLSWCTDAAPAPAVCLTALPAVPQGGNPLCSLNSWNIF